jgi:hypothetical protein
MCFDIVIQKPKPDTVICGIRFLLDTADEKTIEIH